MKMRYCLLMLPILGMCPAKGNGQGNTERGAVIGGLGGALAGAAIGKHNGETAAGALLGGAVGLLAGSALGDAKDREVQRQQAAYQYQYQVQAQAAARAVSPLDVVTLTQSGVSPQVIIAQIRQNGVTQRLDVSDVISLHNQGVHESVITAMQNAPLATVVAAPRPAYPAPVVVQEHYHYVAPPPVYYRPHYYHPHYHYHHGPSSSVHWGMTIRN